MATLVYCDAEGASARYELSGTPVLIGQTAECTIQSRAPLVEAKHARIFEQGGEYWIEDLGSTSGVFVGTQRVRQGRVPFGQVVVVGGLLMRLDEANGDSSRPAFLPGELLELLAVARRRHRELEDERNALGRRVGELHQELQKARDSFTSLQASRATDDTVPRADSMSDAEPVEGAGDDDDLEGLAGAVRAAEARVREVDADLSKAHARHAELASRALAARAPTEGLASEEAERRKAELRSLQTELAETARRREKLADTLAARKREATALRVKARSQPAGPRRTKQFGSAPPPDGGGAQTAVDAASATRITELEQRVGAESTRAAVFEQELDAAKKRLAELEREAEEAASRTAGDAERRLADLKKVLDAAKRETARVRGKLTAATETADEAEERAEAATRRSATVESQRTALEVRIGELEKTVNDRDRELAAVENELAATEAEVAERDAVAEERDRLAVRVAAIEGQISGAKEAAAAAEKSRSAALAARRELDARVIAAESAAKETAAKLGHADRKAREAQDLRETAEARVADLERELSEARDARLAAETAMASPTADGDDTQVLSLKRRLFESQEESDAERERLRRRIVELENDVDRALDAERAALARADVEHAALQAEVDRLGAEASTADEKIAAAELRVSSLREELAESQHREEAAAEQAAALASVRPELERLTAELEDAADRAAAAERRVNEIDVERRRLLVERDRAASLEKELARAREGLRAAREQVADLQGELAAAHEGEDATKDLRTRVVELASQNAQISVEVSQLRDQLVTRDAELETLRAEAALIDEEAERSRDEELARAHDDLTRRYEEVAGELRRANDDLDALREGASNGGSASDALARECEQLRERVAELEVQLSGQMADEMLGAVTTPGQRLDTMSETDDFTAVAAPIAALAEWVMSLQDAVGDLRLQMRAASDEAAMMTGNDESIEIITTALSNGVERVEVAREAIRRIAELVGAEV